MKIEHIISTMNRAEYSFLRQMNLQTNGIVVNQTDKLDNSEYILDNGCKIKTISVLERGLSRSRNRLLEEATGEICIVGDDDVEYMPGYLEIISNAYEKYPDADIIVFRFTHDKNRETRSRYKKDKRYYLWNISKVASVEITFKKKSIDAAGICFNNKIGLGTKFPSGEENAFLADALRAGLKIYHIPKTICYAVEAHTIKDAPGLKKYLITKGAAYYCIYKKLFGLYALAFILLKKKKMLSEISIRQAMNYMRKGKQEYRRMNDVSKYNNTNI